MMRRSTVVTVLACGAVGVTAGAVYASGDESPIAAADASLSKQTPLTGESLGVLATAVGRAADASETRALRESDASNAFRLDLSAVRDVAVGRSTWSVVPGRAGACVILPGGQTFCAPSDDIRTKGALAFSYTPEAPPSRSDESGKVVVGGGAPAPGKPGTVRGIVPNTVSSVVVRDAEGAEVARATVKSNLYEVVVPDFSRAATAESRSLAGTVFSRENILGP